MEKSEFLKQLYIDKKYDELLSDNVDGNCSDEFKAKILLLKGDFEKSAEIYKSLEMYFEFGYCHLLMGDLQKAKEIWNGIEEENPALLWGKSLISFLEGKDRKIPTYMQLRNFLEIELGSFLEHKQWEFVKKILNSAWLFAGVNPECYKYIGRALLNYEFYSQALDFLEKWKNLEFNDPENHYLIAKCYINMGKEDEARKAIKNCLTVAPNYYPALSFFSPDKIL